MTTVPSASTSDGRNATLRFAFWAVRPDVVAGNLAAYRAATGETVRAELVAGDYEASVGEALLAGAGPDVFYAQRAEAALWDAQGLIGPIPDNHPAIRPLLAAMDPRFVAGARGTGGRLLGTTYYNAGPFALFARPGGENRFETWDAVLEHCRRAKRDGRVAHPFVPRWHRTPTGLVWSLLAHLASEGVADLERADAPAVLARTLGCFAALVRDDLVPKDSLGDRGDGSAIERWALGPHLLTFTMDYLAADAAGLAGRPVSVPAARLPGRTGTPLVPGHALVCLRAGLEAERFERAVRLAAYLGGPDVHRRWLEECLFPVPRPALDADPAVRGKLEAFFPPDGAAEAVGRILAGRAGAVVSPPSRRPWMPRWSAEADRLVRDALVRGSPDPAALADRLLERWHDLRRAHRHSSA